MEEIQLKNGDKVEYVSGLTRYGMQCSECYFKEKHDGDCPRTEDYTDYLLCNSDLTGVWRKVEFKPNTAVTSSIDNFIKPEVVTPAAGRKYDAGKPRYSLLPSLALEEVVNVLTFGSEKYGDNNWEKVKDPFDRYFSAANRHMWAWKKGEQNDNESSRHHLAAAIASLMFIVQMELSNAKNAT